MDLIYEELIDESKNGSIMQQNRNLKSATPHKMDKTMAKDIKSIVKTVVENAGLSLDRIVYSDVFTNMELARCKYQIVENISDYGAATRLVMSIRQGFENNIAIAKISLLTENGRTVIILWI